MSTIIYSLIKLFAVALFHMELLDAQKLPQEYRTKCTVLENEWCFTNDIRGACLPGYHRNHEYTDCSPRRSCCPCPQGTFQPERNACFSCIECKNCSKTNQEVSIRCNVTHDTVCGETLTTSIPEASTSEGLPWEKGTVLPDTSEAPEEEHTTGAPDYPQTAAVECPRAWVLILSHFFCFLTGVILRHYSGWIYQNVKSFASWIVGLMFSSQNSSSLEEGKAKPRKKRGKNRNRRQKTTPV